MEKNFYIGQKIIWDTDDFDGVMQIKAVITGVYKGHCIAVSQGNEISNLDGLTLWIDDSTEQYFHAEQRHNSLH